MYDSVTLSHVMDMLKVSLYAWVGINVRLNGLESKSTPNPATYNANQITTRI